MPNFRILYPLLRLIRVLNRILDCFLNTVASFRGVAPPCAGVVAVAHKDTLLAAGCGVAALHSRHVDGVGLCSAKLDPALSITHLAVAAVTGLGPVRIAVGSGPVGSRAVTLALEHGDELDDEGPQDGQTCADDGNVGLDDCPHDVLDIVGGVGRGGQDVERCDSQARGDDDKDAQPKDGHERNFLGHGDLQLVDQRHGQQQNDDVGSDGETCVRIPKLTVIDALAFHGLVEGLLDRGALEDGGYDRGTAVNGHGNKQAPTCPAGPADLAEDSQI